MVFDPMHFLPLLEQKVGALDQAAPLKGWVLPDAFATLHRLTHHVHILEMNGESFRLRQSRKTKA